jgi:hypothetical protein
MEDKIFQSLSNYLIEQESSKLIGKVLKRFDLELEKAYQENRKELTIEQVKTIKANIKETLYEWLRDFRDSINTGRFVLKISKENQKK